MPRTRLFLLGLLLSVGLSVLAGPALAQTTRSINRAVALDRDGQVTLDTFTGSIDVTGWDEARAEVEARIEGEDAELVEKTQLRIESDDGRLSIEVDYDEVKDSQKFLGLFNVGNVDRPGVHITLKMPRGAALTIDDFSSEITVSGLRGDLTLDTFSSDIELREVEGTLELETFSGEVEGTDLRGGVQVETFSGDVELRMTALTEDSHFETFSGDIDLYLPADAGFEIVAEDETFGELDSEFGLRDEDGRRIAGSGGPRIELGTFSGDLRLRKL